MYSLSPRHSSSARANGTPQMIAQRRSVVKPPRAFKDIDNMPIDSIIDGKNKRINGVFRIS